MTKSAKNIQSQATQRKYNKYLKYRRDSEKTKTSFSKELDSTGKTRGKTLRRVEPKGQRKEQQQQGVPRRFAKAKNITLKQAHRLAKYAPIIKSASERHNVPVELICGVILQESGAQLKARSHCGARGLMQLMPATARRFGVKNSYNAAQNIEGGTKYLRWLLDRFDGNVELALAGYNAGEGNVEKYGNKIPPFKETQNYVPAVLGYTQSMVDIIAATQPQIATAEIPAHARRV
jgi:hypothetical protein